jgi:hypothetical protein
MRAAREFARFARRGGAHAVAPALLSSDRMIVHGRVLSLILVSALVIGGCRSGRVHPGRATTLAQSTSFGPCCEREVVHDLFDTAHRQGAR